MWPSACSNVKRFLSAFLARFAGAATNEQPSDTD
jgi:hypothetical protein